MAQPVELETTIYHEKLAMKAWIGRALKAGVKPPEDACVLVWDLLMAYVDSLEDFDRSGEEMYKAAYDLAARALKDMPIGEVSRIYRDFVSLAGPDHTDHRH